MPHERATMPGGARIVRTAAKWGWRYVLFSLVMNVVVAAIALPMMYRNPDLLAPFTDDATIQAFKDWKAQ